MCNSKKITEIYQKIVTFAQLHQNLQKINEICKKKSEIWQKKKNTDICKK